MDLIIHSTTGEITAEVTSDGVVIAAERDAITVLEELFAVGARKVILHQENLAPEFFQLRTRLAGNVLQKFVNYSIQVAIVGDFSAYSSDALKAFIYESNRGSQVFFLDSVESALQKFAVLDNGG
jgi:hypothetical protein